MDSPHPTPDPAASTRRRHPAAQARRNVAIASVGSFLVLTGVFAATTDGSLVGGASATGASSSSSTASSDDQQITSSVDDDDDGWEIGEDDDDDDERDWSASVPDPFAPSSSSGTTTRSSGS